MTPIFQKFKAKSLKHMILIMKIFYFPFEKFRQSHISHVNITVKLASKLQSSEGRALHDTLVRIVIIVILITALDGRNEK